MSNVINAVLREAQKGDIPSVFKTVILMASTDLVSQIRDTSTKYVIRWNYDLKGTTVSIPSNCILDFDGGKISNGTIVWNNTKVLNLYDYTILENVVERGSRTTLEGKYI